MARIAILTAEFAPFRGGIATFVAELAGAARELGHEITVFAPDYGVDDTAHAYPFRVHRYPAGPYSAKHYPAYFRIARHVFKGDFDQILAADIAFIDTMSAMPCRNFNAFVHGSEVVRARKSLKGRIMAAVTNFSRPQRIFANSAYTRDLLLEHHHHVDPAKVTVAHLGVSPSRFATVDTSSLKSRFGIGDENIVACIARITPRKGQANLLKAFASPSLDRVGTVLVIAGRCAERDQDYLEELKSLAEDIRHTRVIFADSLNDDGIQALFAAADLFCLPGSRHSVAVEGFGLVFLEAAAQGTPSVAGAIGGVGEVIDHGRTGLLVEPDDADLLANALKALLENTTERQRMSDQSRLQADTFTWKKCAELVFSDQKNSVS